MGEAADFFVSYTSADRAWAEWIAWQLEAEGYTVVVQAWDFVATTCSSSAILDGEGRGEHPSHQCHSVRPSGSGAI